jgi:hypothetical protein
VHLAQHLAVRRAFLCGCLLAQVARGEAVDAAEETVDTTLPLDFDILAPSAITMPWVKRRRAGSLFWIKPRSRITLVKKRE